MIYWSKIYYEVFKIYFICVLPVPCIQCRQVLWVFSVLGVDGGKLNTFGCKEMIGWLPDKSLLIIADYICKWQKLLNFPTFKSLCQGFFSSLYPHLHVYLKTFKPTFSFLLSHLYHEIIAENDFIYFVFNLSMFIYLVFCNRFWFRTQYSWEVTSVLGEWVWRYCSSFITHMECTTGWHLVNK